MKNTIKALVFALVSAPLVSQAAPPPLAQHSNEVVFQMLEGESHRQPQNQALRNLMETARHQMVLLNLQTLESVGISQGRAFEILNAFYASQGH